MAGGETVRPVKPNRMHLMLCSGTGCVSNNAFKVKEALDAELQKHDLQGEVEVVLTGCNGFCAQGPVMVVKPGEIFYRHGEQPRAVRTRTRSGFEFDQARTLFSLPMYLAGTNDRNYDVSPDGEPVFALRVPDAVAPRRIDVVTGWHDELARLVPPGGSVR